jgi:hypothetical protein
VPPYIGLDLGGKRSKEIQKKKEKKEKEKKGIESEATTDQGWVRGRGRTEDWTQHILPSHLTFQGPVMRASEKVRAMPRYAGPLIVSESEPPSEDEKRKTSENEQKRNGGERAWSGKEGHQVTNPSYSTIPHSSRKNAV